MKKDIYKCLVIESHRFLRWRWVTEYYEHEWAYKGTKERVCAKCGEKEIYFGINYNNGGGYGEDWRRKL